jgi:hypothetical protein
MNIPKRYIWVAAGAIATFGIMAVRNTMAARETRAREDARRRARATEKPGANGSSTDSTADASSSPNKPPLGAAKELDAFLAGDMWHDETGWKANWEREAIGDPAAWLKETGVDVLRTRRAALKDHPALLAGCRRRWIVVCRYATIDVGEAADLWNKTDAQS